MRSVIGRGKINKRIVASARAQAAATNSGAMASREHAYCGENWRKRRIPRAAAMSARREAVN